jgi:hypothetical protein
MNGTPIGWGWGATPSVPCAPSIELMTDYLGKTTLGLLLTSDKLRRHHSKNVLLIKTRKL